MVQIKQDRSRKSGHKHSLNAQDYDYVQDSKVTMRSNLRVMLCLLDCNPAREVLSSTRRNMALALLRDLLKEISE